MISSILIWLVSLLVEQPQDEYFEGIISYNHEYQSSKLNIDSLKSTKSTGSAYLFRDAFYKGFTYSEDTLIFIYNGNIGKCLFARTSISDTYCYDYNTLYESRLISAEITNERTELMGYQCQVLTFKYPDHTSNFYFTDQIKLDPKVYELHNVYDYKKRLDLTKGGLVLLSEHIYPDYKMLIRATSITPSQIGNDEFHIEYSEGC